VIGQEIAFDAWRGTGGDIGDLPGFDTKGTLWVSYTADTEQGRQIKTVRLEQGSRSFGI